MDAERVETGVKGLDYLIDGGFPRNSLIVLAGNPGTGKTVFSSRFLYHGATKCGENGVYVSFAENREVFYRDMQGFGFDFEKLEREGSFLFLDMLTVREGGVSTVLNMMIDAVEEINAKRLIIDSYSALAQAFKEPIDARIISHVIMSKLVRRIGCTTILIEEIPIGSNRIGMGIEEFVADGVLKLNTAILDDRLLRSIEILKLRGTMLKQRKIIFTLHGGFKAFPPFPYSRLEPIKNLRRFQPISDQLDKCSTGSESLDEALGGGIPKGSIMLLEVDEKASSIQYGILVFSIVANFLAQGRRVVMVPSHGIDHLMIKKCFSICGFTEEELNRQLMFLVPYEASENLPKTATLRINDESLEKLLGVIEQVAAETSQPPLLEISVDTLRTLYGEKMCENLLNLIATRVRRSGGVAVIVVKAGYRNLAIRLSPVAETYLRLTNVHGCPLLYGITPRTSLYAVELDLSKGYPLPKLTPII